MYIKTQISVLITSVSSESYPELNNKPSVTSSPSSTESAEYNSVPNTEGENEQNWIFNLWVNK